MAVEIDINKSTNASKAEFTVREMIARLALSEDMDAIVNTSFCNSDPMPVSDVEEDAETGVITLVTSG